MDDIVYVYVDDKNIIHEIENEPCGDFRYFSFGEDVLLME